MSSMARSNGSPRLIHFNASAGVSLSRACMPQACNCRVRMRRLVALSSTIRTRFSFRAGWMPCRSRRLRSGIATVSVWMVKWKAEPSPGIPLLSAHILPPIRLVRRLLMANPRPVPPYLREVEESAWLKDWNSRPIRSAGMPMPVSRTLNSSATAFDFPVSGNADARDTFITTSPCSVNLTALPSRLIRIWRRRVTSPRMAGGTSFSKI